MPWHNSRDPFQWLITELLLRRTTRTAAQKGFRELLATYPGWGELYVASEKEIARKMRVLGLGSQRSKQIKGVAKTVVEKFECVVPQTREVLMVLPGVGENIADAMLLHVYGKWVLPIDSNVQRVLRRAVGLPVRKGTRGSDPYRDPFLGQGRGSGLEF
jgi:endonuclease III